MIRTVREFCVMACSITLLGCHTGVPITFTTGDTPIPPDSTYYVGHARTSISPETIGAVMGVSGIITRIAVVSEAGTEPATYSVVTGMGEETQLGCIVPPEMQMCTNSESLASVDAMTRVGIKVVNPQGNIPLFPTITLVFLPD